MLPAELPSSASGCAIVVEVSPCDTATTLGLCFYRALQRLRLKTVPHSVSMAMTSAPQRRAISTLRWPKRPNTGTSTLSPGSISETSAASIPAARCRR